MSFIQILTEVGCGIPDRILSFVGRFAAFSQPARQLCFISKARCRSGKGREDTQGFNGRLGLRPVRPSVLCHVFVPVFSCETFYTLLYILGFGLCALFVLGLYAVRVMRERRRLNVWRDRLEEERRVLEDKKDEFSSYVSGLRRPLLLMSLSVEQLEGALLGPGAARHVLALEKRLDDLVSVVDGMIDGKRVDAEDVCADDSDALAAIGTPAHAGTPLAHGPKTDDGSCKEYGDIKRFCVLVVGADADLREMVCEALGRWYRVVKAGDGGEAMNVLACESVDAIVCDVSLPGKDGNEFCHFVKSAKSYSHLPFILLAASAKPGDKLVAMRNGVDVYMEKPFSVKQLHLQIRNMLFTRQKYHLRVGEMDSKANSLVVAECGMAESELEVMEEIERILDENIRHPDFSIDTMAGLMDMSRSSFYRKLKSLTGMTPIDFLRVQRMNRAKMLLDEGRLISDVAAMVGFTSPSYFSKCFRTQFGVLPKDYVARK